MQFEFKIEKKNADSLGRAGKCVTPHGEIKTPCFVAVGTRGAVKAMTPEQVKSVGIQVVLGNTYHLYLEPGEQIVRANGGLGKMMHWSGPTMTDSGGFQIFSLGAAYGKKLSKFGDKKSAQVGHRAEVEYTHAQLACVDEQGATFRSHIDGSEHRFTPEKSIQIQHDIGADIIFAFDECPSPEASYEYQIEAMDRTHRWALQSLEEHQRLGGNQALFGIVQGGRFEDLRKKSAVVIGSMDFAGFGIGGSFEKQDMGTAVRWVNELLPGNKPRHLLGIGEPEDLLLAIENGCDFFDCVMPTRLGRNGTFYTKIGKMSIQNSRFAVDTNPLEDDCDCYTCANFSRAYVSHLFRVKEMLGSTLASIHNLAFISRLVSGAREAIMKERFGVYKDTFLSGYKTQSGSILTRVGLEV